MTKTWVYQPVPRCEVCGSSDRRWHGVRTPQPVTQALHVDPSLPRTDVYECRDCGLFYSDPRPSGHSVEAVYGTVDDYFSIAIDDARLEWYRGLARKLERIRGTAGTLLDVGCGRGEFVAMAREVGWDASGIDPDPHFVEFARSHFGLESVRSVELEVLEAEGATFDAMSLNAVLEHIPEPAVTVGRISRMLRPGGALFIEVPHGHIARFWAADRLLRLAGSRATTHLSPFHAPYHLYEFSERSLRVLLDRFGIDVVHVEFWPGTNRAPRGRGVKGRLMHILYGALVRLENLTGRTYNLHVYARRRAS